MKALSNWIEKDRARMAASRAYWDNRPAATTRVPLRTEQHILHLILTICTAGLWIPVWIIRTGQGNRVPAVPPQWQPPQNISR